MEKSKGRGWHGNPEAHAAAGRKGGLAKRKPKDKELTDKQE